MHDTMSFLWVQNASKILDLNESTAEIMESQCGHAIYHPNVLIRTKKHCEVIQKVLATIVEDMKCLC